MNLASVVNIFFANEAKDLFIVRNAVGNSGRKQVRNIQHKFAKILCVKLIPVSSLLQFEGFKLGT